MVRYGFVTQEELASGKAAPGSAKATPALTVAMASDYSRSIPSAKDPAIAPLFQVGQRVRARNINPVGHTRLPRYARGKTGQIGSGSRRVCIPRYKRRRVGCKTPTLILSPLHPPVSFGA